MFFFPYVFKWMKCYNPSKIIDLGNNVQLLLKALGWRQMGTFIIIGQAAHNPQAHHRSLSQLRWCNRKCTPLPLKHPGQKELTLMIKPPDLTPGLQGISEIRENTLKRQHEDTISKILDTTWKLTSSTKYLKRLTKHSNVLPLFWILSPTIINNKKKTGPAKWLSCSVG